ncbi:hypothetical protein ODZ83_09085 [Acaricomes phytoseiuli]|uniref:hypothetical protein n=1 Tax=Acaricomes phytoseiuli TaxID=291968 RepID=UPI002223A84F|nr:hypothetical protein [Acaricomes phytoseiuli]MCW1250328.1 hypothetical protein [Acaricomes phytoseiuli]
MNTGLTGRSAAPDARVHRSVDWPGAGFPGVAVNPETLRREVVDDELCAAALAESTEDWPGIVVSLARNRVNEAAELVAAARVADPGSIRLQLFEADVAAAAHDSDRALRILRLLQADYRGRPAESSISQHLGQAYFLAGDYRSAVSHFSAALELRVAHRAPAEQIHVSTIAVQRARELLERHCSVA